MYQLSFHSQSEKSYFLFLIEALNSQKNIDLAEIANCIYFRRFLIRIEFYPVFLKSYNLNYNLNFKENRLNKSQLNH